MIAFDPYHKWLGIPPEEQPPDHYRLLGLQRFESDPEVIEAAADQRMIFLQRCAIGEHVAESQSLLNEIARARVSLLNEKKRSRYDAALRSLTDDRPSREVDPPARSHVDAFPDLFDAESESPASPSRHSSTRSSTRRGDLRRNTRKRSGRANARNLQRSLILGGIAAVLIVGFLIWALGGEAGPSSDPDGREPSGATVADSGELAGKTQLDGQTPAADKTNAGPTIKNSTSAGANGRTVGSAPGSDRLVTAAILNLVGDDIPTQTTFASGTARECTFPPFLAVSVAGEERTIATRADLPQSDFQITRINLNGFKQVDDTFLEQFASLRELQHLALGQTNVTDEGLAHLRELKNLKSLFLHGTKVTNDGMHIVGRISNLAVLGLGRTAVDDQGLSRLNGLANLQRLWLDTTGVTDDGLIHLRAFPGLWQLDLEGLALSSRGLQHLGNLSALRWLAIGSISGNLNDSDVTWLDRLALERLRLVGRKITSDALQHVRGMTTLRLLDVVGTGVDARGLAHVKNLTRLETLVFPNSPTPTADADSIKHLRNLTALRKLPIRFPRSFDDDDLAELRGLVHLRHLNLSDTTVSDAGMPTIAGMRKLQSLYLSGTRVSEQGLSQLESLSELQVLYLHNTAIGERGMKSIASLRNLETLHLSSTKAVSDGSIHHLGSLRKLRVLCMSLSRETLSERGLLALPDFEHIESLLLHDGNNGLVTEQVCQRIAKYSSLQSLSLYDAKVTASAVRAINRIGSLRSLSLSGSSIDDRSLDQLSLPRLKTLYLSRTGIGDAGLRSVARLKSLESLYLSDTKITDGCIADLKSLSRLRYLSLYRTRLTSAGMASLRQALPGCGISWRAQPVARKPSPPRFHAIWQQVRSSAELGRWQETHDLDAAALSTRLKAWSGTWRPVSISGYEGPDGKSRFAVVWTFGGATSRVEIDLDRQKHQLQYDNLPKGYIPASVDFYRAGSKRHAAVVFARSKASWWARSDCSNTAFDQFQVDYARTGYRPAMLSGMTGWSGGERYHGVWIKDGRLVRADLHMTATELSSKLQTLRTQRGRARPVWIDSYLRNGKRTYSLLTERGRFSAETSVTFDLTKDQYEAELTRQRKRRYVPVLVKVD